ncbi:unnamed protein product [Caenorhabditis angaria]|uniref:Serpentine Receptor, class H n=1 Tax=Caenorhabditis angaria TaxID=860376 RepID=A0A9P1N3B6_9PELO|nr:unnamed protein product [Caenorhabditis angaria]
MCFLPGFLYWNNICGMDLECLNREPFYYTLCLHVLALISFPINLFGCYLIVSKSPKNSKYKYRQLYVQIVTSIVENYMTWIGGGYYLFPMVGGFNTSSITTLVTNPHTSVVFYFFVFAFELPALLSCFQYRADSAAELDEKSRIPSIISYTICFLCHCYPFVIAISLYLSKLSPEEQYRFISTNFPKCIHVLENPEFIVYDYSTNFWLGISGISTMIWTVSYALYFLFLAIRTVRTLQAMRTHMSIATFKLHQTALLTLSLQVLIPSSLVLTPIIFIFIVVVKKLSQYQEIATDTTFLIAAHSMVSTIVIICCSSRYLEVVRDIFCLIPWKMETKINPIVERSAKF